MNGFRPLKVAIDAPVDPGMSGGVGQLALALIDSLGTLPDGAEAYVIVTRTEQQAHCIRPHLGPNQKIVIRCSSKKSGRAPSHSTPSYSRPIFNRLARPLLSLARRKMRGLARTLSDWPEIPISDGFYEGLGCDVIHFLSQYNFTLCALPTIYNPHDLQHLHYPQFFSPSVIAYRETMYPAACRLSHAVIVGSNWIKSDVIRHYALSPEKIQVIPEAGETCAEVLLLRCVGASVGAVLPHGVLPPQYPVKGSRLDQ